MNAAASGRGWLVPASVPNERALGLDVRWEGRGEAEDGLEGIE